MLDYIQAAFGLLALFLAGDLLVRGAVSAGLRLQIPVIIIGLTIVAFGTSAPELFVTVQASINGTPGIAVGNVVGSNIANVLLVIGLPALLSPLGDSSMETKRNYMIMIGVTFVAVAFVFFHQVETETGFAASLTFWHGLALLSLLALFLYDTYRSSVSSRAEADAELGAAAHLDAPSAPREAVAAEMPHDVEFEEISDADPNMPVWKIAGLILIGIVGLPLGAWLTVDSATRIAASAGLSDELIGLTLVAIGTSLPELATTVMAAVRGRADVAIGNVIGSNIFNLLAILGVAAMLDDLSVPMAFVQTNFLVMVLSSLALAPFIWLNRDVGRLWGGVFVFFYVAYVAFLLQPPATA